MALVLKKSLVSGAGEYDLQPPSLLPGSAVSLLDQAAVTGETLRAVAGGVHEYPSPAADRHDPRHWASGGQVQCRVAAGVAVHAQARDLFWVQASDLGEPCGDMRVQRQHGVRQRPAGVAAAAGSPASAAILAGGSSSR